jgi:lipopolysaccharide/colanic/teichoic acid biosynthesis glycosyltransferase
MNKNVPKKPIYDFVKRCFDIIVSVLALIVSSPFWIVIAIIIKLTSSGPVLFAHKRVGKNGKEIKVYKFRSMVKNAEELIDTFTPQQMEEYKENYKLADDPRVTTVGKFLRKTSMDELPQFINVLKGDLSLVGPRPVLQEETELYGKYREMLLSIKPGLTGFWATSGRNDVTYPRRCAMEIFYVKNRSISFDIKIILKTFVSVFQGEGTK